MVRRTAPVSSVAYMTEPASALCPRPKRVAQFVGHDRLEVVLPRSDGRGVGTGVPVPALDERDLARIRETAEHTLGVAARGTGRADVQNEIGQAPVGDFRDRHVVRGQEDIQVGDRLVEPRQVVGTKEPSALSTYRNRSPASNSPAVIPVPVRHSVGGQRAGPVAADLEPVHHERDLVSELRVAAHGQQRGRGVDRAA